MRPGRTALPLLAKTKTGEKLLRDRRSRIVFFVAVSFGCNLLYALYHGALGIMNASLWFVAMCAFYGILATMRFSAVLCERKSRRSPSDDTERFVMRLSGALFVALSLVLAAVNHISLSQNIAAKHGEITMITIAAYTFYKLTMAVVRGVKQRADPSPLLRTIRNIGCAEVAASVLTLQRSMLVSFGAMDGGRIRLMNAATGAAVCAFVLALGISMMTTSAGKERRPWQDQNL